MRNRFDRQLKQLNDEMIRMGSLIEQAIATTVSALISRDLLKARAVGEYENEINRQEKEIENLCMKLLLQQQPVAGDLRLVSSALKMVTDMERIGDQAEDISELVTFLPEDMGIKKLEHIQCMAKETMYMVVKSVEAFVKKDKQMALQVIAHDDVVDELFLKMKQDVTDMINNNAEDGEMATDLLMVSKYFERIGDHAVNIADWVFYSIVGYHSDGLNPEVQS